MGNGKKPVGDAGKYCIPMRPASGRRREKLGTISSPPMTAKGTTGTPVS